MQKTLEGWETYLRSYLGHIRLLGEIPLDETEIQSIGDLVKTLIKTQGLNKATRVLKTEYKLTFVTLMAEFASINTEKGFWDAFSQSIGVQNKQQLYNHDWHKSFISIIGKLGLEKFDYPGTDIYVTSIRIHGGIPAYSLPDYFEYMLLPSTEKIYWRDLPVEEFIQKAISEEFRYYGDRTVINFFQFSDSIGVDYLKASQQMVKGIKEKGFFEPIPEMSLPAYVVDAYEEFLHRKMEERPGESAPGVLLSCYERTITLTLPKSLISPTLAENDLLWKIFIPSSGYTEEIPVRLIRAGINVFTSEDQFQLLEPAKEIILSLISKGKANQEEMVHRIWKIPVFPNAGKSPLVLWQNIQDQPTLLCWRQKIPAEMLAVLLPAECYIHVDGEENRLGEFGQLQDAFSDWKLEVWDFTKADYILVEKDTDFPWPAIPIKAKSPEITFAGCEPFSRDKDPDGSLLFVNQIPSLQFPCQKDSTNLDKWRVTLTSEGIEHSLNATFTLKEAREQINFNENHSVLNISKFFKESPIIGSYKAEIKGPLGFEQILKFRLWPNLTVLNLPNSIEAKSEDKIDFTIASTLEFECERQTDQENVSIEKTVGLYKVSIPLTVERIDLYLTTRTKAGIPIRVPIYLAIPSVKWMVGGISAITRMEVGWHHHEFSIALDLLLQAQQPYLHLKVYGQEVDRGRSRLILCDPTQPENEVQVINPKSNNLDTQTINFDLSGIKNNLGYFFEISIFQLKAEISYAQKNDPLVLSLVALKRALKITDVDLVELSRDDLRYQLTWKEEYPLRNRRALIWSVWQPWADPIELRIPDDAKGLFEFSGFSLPPSHYRVAFYTAYPGEEKRKDIPREGFHDVKKVDAQVKLKEITQKFGSEGEDIFLLHFTLACIYHSMSDEGNFQQEITWCRQHFTSASISKAINFYNWLDITDSLTQKATAMKMRQPEMLEALFNNYEKDNPIRKRYIQILTAIKIDFQNLQIAWLLLKNSNEPLLEFRSFNSLLSNEDKEIVGITLNWIDKGRLSIGNAVEILVKNPNFSLDNLEMYKSQNPLANVLIKKILDQCEDLAGYIKRGYFLSTEVGTGTIVKVLGKNREEIDYLREGEGDGFLIVALHDEISGEIVEIDLEKRTIHFLDAERLFICTKCNQFVSACQEKVVNEHNKISHRGIGPAFRPIQSTTIDLKNAPIIKCNRAI
ncbi:MAG TPA: hypothetical protein DCK95_10770 [Anaerolineaceae bacterium]|uniref:RNA polymerase, sigma 70 subunit, RpoD subfamily n=1 Tax=Anaerolinea thermophila TaxID=167964 RepID=A0A101FYT5_9CHLR|nr:MAG: RNA polymerase, sigma 70 subunit, RpoD subfamily [Anaerolinea thermophila]HAF62790.1 hypothetical protein [Anaerolineaceae bacterium]